MLLGKTTPRVFTPELRELSRSTSLGFQCIDFAERVLDITLYEWQKWLLVHALELNPDGSFRFRKVFVLVGRQNGKSTLLQILTLWRMYLDGARLILGTAQDRALAREQWLGAVQMAQSIPDLAGLIADRSPATARGFEHFALSNGSQYKVAASNASAGRGLSVDLLLMDELRTHRSWDAWAGVSKDLANTTEMLRSDGTWTTIGDLSVGEEIFSPSGMPVKITEVIPIPTLRKMYRVTGTDGRSIVASESHLWTVKDMRKSYDMSSGWETLTTAEILGRGLLAKSGTYKAFRLPKQAELLGLPEKNLELDPYILGLWLGDGTTLDGTVTVGGGDLPETIRQLEHRGATIYSKHETRPGVWRVRIHIDGMPMRGILNDIGVLGDKHVPESYLTASTNQRLELLRGLLDSDGHVTNSGCAAFSNTNRALSDAVMFLARSLGFVPRLKERAAKLYDKECNATFNVIFRVYDTDPMPFSIERKAGSFRFSRPARSRLHTSIESIVEVDSEPSTCISVDSDDHLFLAGRDLLPTHNTTNARKKGQVWGVSSAGDVSSIVLRHFRKVGHMQLGDPDGLGRDPVTGEVRKADIPDELVEEDDSIGVFEWSADPSAGVWDREAWAQANPSIGYGAMTEKILASDAASDPEWVFRNEVLCQWFAGSSEGVFPAGSWLACVDEDSTISDSSPLIAGIDVSWDRSTAHIVFAGYNDLGRVHIESVARRFGTDWVKNWLMSDDRYRRPDLLVWQTNGAPVSSMAEDLQSMGIPNKPWAFSDLGKACGMFYDLVRAVVLETGDTDAGLSAISHTSQPVMDIAANTARVKAAGDAWIWDRAKSPSDIAPLVAATGAVWGLLTNGKMSRSVYEDFDLMILD